MHSFPLDYDSHIAYITKDQDAVVYVYNKRTETFDLAIDKYVAGDKDLLRITRDEWIDKVLDSRLHIDCVEKQLSHPISEKDLEDLKQAYEGLDESVVADIHETATSICDSLQEIIDHQQKSARRLKTALTFVGVGLGLKVLLNLALAFGLIG